MFLKERKFCNLIMAKDFIFLDFSFFFSIITRTLGLNPVHLVHFSSLKVNVLSDINFRKSLNSSTMKKLRLTYALLICGWTHFSKIL